MTKNNLLFNKMAKNKNIAVTEIRVSETRGDKATIASTFVETEIVDGRIVPSRQAVDPGVKK